MSTFSRFLLPCIPSPVLSASTFEGRQELVILKYLSCFKRIVTTHCCTCFITVGPFEWGRNPQVPTITPYLVSVLIGINESEVGEVFSLTLSLRVSRSTYSI